MGGIFSSSTGQQGLQGPQGPQGPQGQQGPKGDTGLKGQDGVLSLDSLNATQFDRLLKAILEDSRSKGPKGDTGSVGPKGDTGLQGPKGDIDTTSSEKGSQLIIRGDNYDWGILSTRPGVDGGSSINFNPVFGGNVRIGYNPNDFWPGANPKDINVPNSKLAVKGDIYSDNTSISKNINIGNKWMIQTDDKNCLLFNKIENNNNSNVYKICPDSTNTILPKGSIIAWSGDRNNVPIGWVLCEGQTIGNLQIPDLRGRFILGGNTDANKLSSLGKYDYNSTGGREVALLKHTHTLGPNKNLMYIGGGGSDNLGGGNFYSGLTPKNMNETGNVENDGKDNTLPPYYVLAYIYKL